MPVEIWNGRQWILVVFPLPLGQYVIRVTEEAQEPSLPVENVS